MNDIRPVEWCDGAVKLLDQRLLPEKEQFLVCRDWREVRWAIGEMVVRGAPAIGIAGAYAAALAAEQYGPESEEFRDACERIASVRPTAVNLRWAIERIVHAAKHGKSLLEEAKAIHEENVAANRAIGAFGAELMPADARVITICNTGALATGGYGTALGVVRAAHEAGKRPFVWVLETRPLLQGSRLTAWELQKLGIPFTVVADGAAGTILRQGRVHVALVGADRIAANGDTANKVGTFALAVLCRYHEVPFYVVAPSSTFDLQMASGDAIPIEERAPEEVTECRGRRIAPEGASAYNPAFDVTPGELVTGFITEIGLCKPPFSDLLQPKAPSSGRE